MQFLLEALVVSAVGGLLGILLARWPRCCCP